MLVPSLVSDEKRLTNLSNAGAAMQSVTAGAAGVYGSATQLLSAAAVNYDCWGISVIVAETGASATVSGGCLDILAGAATEDVLISSLLVGWVFGGPNRCYFFPVFIPAGTRIAARFASEVASKVCNVGVYLHTGPAPMPVGRKVITYGAKNNDARGQTIVPSQSGAAASATQLAAASSEDHIYLLPGFEPYNDTTIANNNYAIGIGVGAATEERIGTWQFGFDSGEKGNGPLPPIGVFRNVPAGTRLSLLAANQGTNDTTYGGLIYAVA